MGMVEPEGASPPKKAGGEGSGAGGEETCAQEGPPAKKQKVEKSPKKQRGTFGPVSAQELCTHLLGCCG